MISYMETHIEDACNLKCRGCSHFSVFAKPRRKDLNEFEREFRRLAEIEEIGIIRLMGGEPLINPDFMEYVRIARRYFPTSRISLVTNGILAKRLEPHTEELQALRVGVTMSDYHLESQDMSKCSERHDKGQMYNVSFDLSGQQNGEEAFRNCDLQINNWFFLRDGRFYPCCVAGCIQDFWEHFGLDWGIDTDDLSIDIFTHTAEEIEAFLKRPTEMCRYCDTLARAKSYRPFERSRGDISEWTRQTSV